MVNLILTLTLMTSQNRQVQKKVCFSNDKQNSEPESKLEVTANITPNIQCTFVRQVRVQGLIKRQWFDNSFSQSYIPMSDLCRENIDLPNMYVGITIG